MGNYTQSGVLYEAGEMAADNALCQADEMHLPINDECRQFWRAWFGLVFANLEKIELPTNEVFDISGYINVLGNMLNSSAHPVLINIAKKMDNWTNVGGYVGLSMDEVWPFAPESCTSFDVLRAMAQDAHLMLLALSNNPARIRLSVKV